MHQNNFGRKVEIMKKNVINIIGITLLTILVIAAFAQQPAIRRTELQRNDLIIPGYEAVQVRIDFDPGTAFGNHTHYGQEIIYVLEGEIEYKLEGHPAVTLKKGEVLLIPTGKIHSAKNAGSSLASELATYIVEKGKPIVTLVK